MSGKRNITLEIIKLLASYFVVFIHVKFSGHLGDISDAIARFAVPLFFLVSGFFSYNIDRAKINSRARSILLLIIVSTVIYTLFNVVRLIAQGNADEVGLYFSDYLNFKILVRLFVFNVPVSALHLWYLFAIFYVYIIYYLVIRFCNHKKTEKVIFVLSFSLLLLNLILGEGLSVFNVHLSPTLLRNFLMTGIPFFGIGLFVRKHEAKFGDIKNFVSIGAIVIGAALSVASKYLFLGKELYFGSVLIIFGLVNLFIKYQYVKYPKYFNTITEVSTYIYIFHVMIASIISSFFNLSNVLTLMTCVASTLIAYLITTVKKAVLLKIKKKTQLDNMN